MTNPCDSVRNGLRDGTRKGFTKNPLDNLETLAKFMQSFSQQIGANGIVVDSNQILAIDPNALPASFQSSVILSAPCIIVD